MRCSHELHKVILLYCSKSVHLIAISIARRCAPFAISAFGATVQIIAMPIFARNQDTVFRIKNIWALNLSRRTLVQRLRCLFLFDFTAAAGRFSPGFAVSDSVLLAILLAGRFIPLLFGETLAFSFLSSMAACKARLCCRLAASALAELEVCVADASWFSGFPDIDSNAPSKLRGAVSKTQEASCWFLSLTSSIASSSFFRGLVSSWIFA